MGLQAAFPGAGGQLANLAGDLLQAQPVGADHDRGDEPRRGGHGDGDVDRGLGNDLLAHVVRVHRRHALQSGRHSLDDEIVD